MRKKLINAEMISDLTIKKNSDGATQAQRVASPMRNKVILPPRPTQSMITFESGLKPGETFIDERLLSINGWLAPTGELYCCRWQEHDKISTFFGCNVAHEMFGMGYIRLSQMRFMLKEVGKNALNDENLTTIKQWHEENDLCTERFELDMASLE